jgi:hypothetical protein
MVKQIKSKKDRLSEGINILKQLSDAGVKKTSPGFIELKEKITEWVNSESSWQGVINFMEYGRIADIELPKYDNRAAGLNFKVRRTGF